MIKYKSISENADKLLKKVKLMEVPTYTSDKNPFRNNKLYDVIEEVYGEPIDHSKIKDIKQIQWIANSISVPYDLIECTFTNYYYFLGKKNYGTSWFYKDPEARSVVHAIHQNRQDWDHPLMTISHMDNMEYNVNCLLYSIPKFTTNRFSVFDYEGEYDIEKWSDIFVKFLCSNLRVYGQNDNKFYIHPTELGIFKNLLEDHNMKTGVTYNVIDRDNFHKVEIFKSNFHRPTPVRDRLGNPAISSIESLKIAKEVMDKLEAK